jgi:pyoverdine/dityrosine biosynthesis protein Dit1
MTELKTDDNRVDATIDGKFHAFWHGQVVFENGRVKRFETEREAWGFLARCDVVGKIIH